LNCHSLLCILSCRYQSIGRKHVQASGAVVAILPLLWNADVQVRARAAGVVHNLSSHPTCVTEIRVNDGIGALMTLLKEGDDKVSSAAAGAIQNVAREEASRQEILAFPEALRHIGRLLFRRDVQCQAFAVGALLNLFTPTFEVTWLCATFRPDPWCCSRILWCWCW